nr:hypothetical protein [Bacilli bacterium]
GIVGYISDTYGNLSKCKNTYNMTCGLGNTSTNAPYAIGGVIGAGYTQDVGQLENVGDISINSSTYQKELYAAGIIGRHLGIAQEVSNFNNQGDISINRGSNTKSTYVAGIENVDIQTEAAQTIAYSQASKLKVLGKYVFRGSKFTNRADISITTSASNNLEYTNVLNVNSSNGFISEVSGIYNLNYRTIVTGTSIPRTISEEELAATSIDVSTIAKFASVINKIGTYDMSASTIYNLRDLEFTSSAANTNDDVYKYSACILGTNITYEDIRNEGQVAVSLTKSLGASESDLAKIYFTGLIEEVSEGNKAEVLYNGGNISITYSANIYADLTISGISIRHINGYSDSEIAKYNPSTTVYNSKATGSINNAINNGDIIVDNTGLSNVDGGYTTIKSANGQSNLGSAYVATYNTPISIHGDIKIAGLVFDNESVITNSFNTGDLSAYNYIVNNTVEKEIEVAGLVTINVGKCAYILNSANNGIIKAVNMSTGTDYASVYKSNVNAAGIVARNDETAAGTAYTANADNPNSQQVISFTINYGDVFAYNYRTNIQSTTFEPSSKAAGIVAMGLLNTINVMNYGSVFGSEAASGIFGVLYFAEYANEVSADNKVNIANTINYGNVYMLSRGYNNTHGSSALDYKVISYARLKALTANNIVIENSTLGNIEAFTSVVRNSLYVSTIGSVFALANYATAESSEYIQIRYLISFNEDCPIVGSTVSAPSGVSVDTSTLYSAHVGIDTGTGAYENDTWLNSYVTYAPASTESVSGRFITARANDGSVTIQNQEYYGIFNDEFGFRKAIKGVGLDLSYQTDNYLTDYFQFVGFKFINQVLLDKIGWRSVAYNVAAATFAKDINNVITLFDKSSYDLTSLGNTALSDTSWLKYLEEDTMNDVLAILLEGKDKSAIMNFFEQIFAEQIVIIDGDDFYSILSDAEEIGLIDDYSSIISEILTYENGYTQKLANLLSYDSDNNVKEYLDDYINSLDNSTKIDLISRYISYTSDTYFNLDDSNVNRTNILTNFFSNVPESDYSSFYKLYYELLYGSETSSS